MRLGATMELAKQCLNDLMEIMWYRGSLPEEGRAMEIIEQHLNAVAIAGMCLNCGRLLVNGSCRSCFEPKIEDFEFSER